MPWDYVQESVISIPPSQADHLETEYFKLAVERSSDPIEPGAAPFVSESRAELSSPTDIPAEETPAFSIAHPSQMPVTSSASEIAAANLGPTNVPTETAFGQQNQNSTVRWSARWMDESSILEARVATIPSPVFKDESVEDDREVPEEMLPPSAGSVLSTDDRTITADLNPVQEVTAEPPVALSQSTRETLSRESNGIPPRAALPQQENIWELPPKMADPPHFIKETTEARVHERFLREEVSGGRAC